ncbi:ATP-grasp domain-containing protein [Sulfobacillus sp. hq2]|uniref:ATP-grasp domain-containing protein n=1 Tax=Sulfobacillus TaxID=28033 RepID=UPI000CD314CE|nr:ATP-grasp domain-containing protein [Sulfobacillus sp. hq2]POB11397.1 hypothetical protein CO251_04435 [Sulfobacillus sp. hq2]
MNVKHLAVIETNATGHGVYALKVAHSLGYHPLFLTRDPSFYGEAWDDIARYAADIIRIDTYDVAAMDHCLRQREPVQGIIAFDDYHLLQAAELAAQRGLPHVNRAGLERCRNKYLTRKRLQEAGHHQPHYVVLTSTQPMPHESPFGYPCVVKPVDDSGSVGVTLCRTSVEFRQALERLRQRAVNVRGYHLAAQWLVEEYIEGPEYSAEFIWDQGAWHLLGLTQKRVSRPPYFVELGHGFPYVFADALHTRVVQQLDAWLAGIGLRGGAAHVEFRMRGEEPMLMEINPRLGGDLIPDLIHRVIGIDLVQQQLRWAMGEETPRCGDPVVYHGACAIRFIVPPRPGVIRAIHNTARTPHNPTDVVIRALPLTVGLATNSYERLGYVITCGESLYDAELSAENQMAALHFEWEA